MTSTPTRIASWRPASPQPLGVFLPTAASTRDTTADCKAGQRGTGFSRLGAVGWKGPHRGRVRALPDRPREMYGIPVNEPHRDPIGCLVHTVLSQHTNDTNSGRAYASL